MVTSQSVQHSQHVTGKCKLQVLYMKRSQLCLLSSIFLGFSWSFFTPKVILQILSWSFSTPEVSLEASLHQTFSSQSHHRYCLTRWLVSTKKLSKTVCSLLSGTKKEEAETEGTYIGAATTKSHQASGYLHYFSFTRTSSATHNTHLSRHIPIRYS